MRLTSIPSRTNVLETTDPYFAQIMKLRLEEEGIPVVLFDQRDSSYNAFGYLYLSVPTEFEEQALELINKDTDE